MPYAKLLLAVAAAALACLALVALLRSRRREGPMVTQTRAMPNMKGSLDANRRGRGVSIELGREIVGMLEAGRRDEALALIRGCTGRGAQEADAMLVKLEKLWKRLES
jgi:hypothetical protein